MFKIAFEAVSWAVIVAVFAVLTLTSPVTAYAHEAEHTVTSQHAHDPTDIWAIARGGQLYDNWMSVLEADNPTETHPAYPKTSKRKGAATWRCKECHGWDYMGKDGTYAKGSHFTGIKGVRDMVGKNPEEMHEIIMDKTHAFNAQMIPHSAMEKLALFLSKGQIDTERYIDREAKRARGNPRRGARFFQTVCSVCHGFDGRDINFKDPPKAEFVGTVCAKNPWEALHKIRFGQPGIGMVALAVLDIEDLVDLVAYCQTLPTK